MGLARESGVRFSPMVCFGHISKQNIAIIIAFIALVTGVGIFICSYYSSHGSITDAKHAAALSQASSNYDTQQYSPKISLTTSTDIQSSGAPAPQKGVEAQNWITFSDLDQFGIQFKYPGSPVVLTKNVITGRSGYIQLSFPQQFVINLDVSPASWDLDEWLYEPPQPDDYTNYQYIEQEIKSTPGMSLASTTVDGTLVIEIGVDCSRVNASLKRPRMNLLSGWGAGYYDEVLTVRNGVFYQFTAYDVCKFSQGAGLFRTFLSTVRFQDNHSF